MRKFIQWLRSLGPIGGFVATLVTLLATSWGIVMSALIGFGASISALAISWAQSPRVQTGVEVFLAVLWTYIGLLVVRSRKTPTSVRIYHDYAYALAYEAAGVVIDADNPDVLAVNFSYRNVGAGPIKFLVDDMRVILNGRTAEHPATMSREVILPRAAGKSFRSAMIEWDKIKSSIKGTADITILYGHPEIGYERKLKLKFQLVGTVANEKVTAFTAGIELESDTPYRSS